ncbi:MAG: ATP-binding protein [Pseudomonadota bacterium]|nr:ATP-binding protein [Pseudomonadota bacterium]
MAANRPLVRAAALAAFLLAAAGATVAEQMDRPVTAALAFLLGVTLVGAWEGLRGGLLAAILASVIYNVFLSDPVFRFSLTSAEDYVPLIAFNLSAAASGFLAGRLKDRALAAESSNRRIRALLEVSHRLQAAVEMEDIPAAIAGFADAGSGSEPEIFVRSEGALLPLQKSSQQVELAQQLLASGEPSLRRGDHKALALSTPAGARAVLVIEWPITADQSPEQHDLEALVNLLSITLERCLLLKRLSEAELVKRSEEFKTALLSSVSHDMRTPLSAISASASSLTRFGAELHEDMRRDLLSTIQEQCERLNRYTTNLLNLGRIQAGVDHRQFTECDALEVLGAAISRTRTLGGSHRITKKYDVFPAPVRADPVMLEQVFYNVLENAVRYSPEESPVVVSARVIDSDLALSISDAGEGILQADLELVFERFYRSRSSLHHEGSGLGLSIARGFTEAFGGSIKAERSDKRLGGTTINILLPLQPSSLPAS